MSQGNTQADTWRGESHLSPGDTLRPDDTHSHTPEQWYSLDNTVLTTDRAPRPTHGRAAGRAARTRTAPGRAPCAPAPRAGAARRAPAHVHHSRSTQRQTRTVFYTWKRDTYHPSALTVWTPRAALWGAHGTVHNSLKDKVLSYGPTRARCDVGRSLVSTTARAAPTGTCAPGRLAAPVTTTAALTQPPTRHGPRCGLSRSRVGGGGGGGGPPPPPH